MSLHQTYNEKEQTANRQLSIPSLERGGGALPICGKPRSARERSAVDEVLSMSGGPTRQPLNFNFVAEHWIGIRKWRKTAISQRDRRCSNPANRPESGDLSTESAGDVGAHRLRFALDQLDSDLHQVAD